MSPKAQCHWLKRFLSPKGALSTGLGSAQSEKAGRLLSPERAESCQAHLMSPPWGLHRLVSNPTGRCPVLDDPALLGLKSMTLPFAVSSFLKTPNSLFWAKNIKNIFDWVIWFWVGVARFGSDQLQRTVPNGRVCPNRFLNRHFRCPQIRNIITP